MADFTTHDIHSMQWNRTAPFLADGQVSGSLDQDYPLPPDLIDRVRQALLDESAPAGDDNQPS